MKYQNGVDLLPLCLIKQIQEYVDGCTIYIPRKDAKSCLWGEKSSSRFYYEIRNKQIKDDFRKGLTIDTLAKMYNLSVDSIKRIVYKK